MSEHTAEKDAGTIETGKAGVSDAETLAAEPGQSVVEPADRVKHPGTSPIRVCCGQRHRGSVCPDGLVMCCICFNRVPKERLTLVEEGGGDTIESAPIYVDMCVTCKKREDRWGTRVAPATTAADQEADA